jgi:phosphatidylglycerophosphatase A
MTTGRKSAAYWIAVGLGAGHFPVISGTTGTIPFWLALYAWTRLVQPSVLWMPLVSMVVTFIGFWAATKAEEELGEHDPKQIVIDEWAGMAITLIGVPPRLSSYIAAFLLFRIFDVIKPPPARQLEKLPGGYGIVMDDVFAGFYALIVYHVAHKFLPSLL